MKICDKSCKYYTSQIFFKEDGKQQEEPVCCKARDFYEKCKCKNKIKNFFLELSKKINSK